MDFRVGWCLTFVIALCSISHLSCYVYKSQVFKIKSWKTYFSRDAHIDFSVSDLENLYTCMPPTQCTKNSNGWQHQHESPS